MALAAIALFSGPALHAHGHSRPAGGRSSAAHRPAVGHGFHAKLEFSTRPIPKVQPRRPTAGLPLGETVTYKKSVEVFNWMARQSDIAFRFPVNGCYARAHLMCQRMIRNKFRPRKIWSFPNGETLFARTRNNPKGYVTWRYHVAPVLRVRLDASAKTQRWYVIDPSLFTRPVTVAQWERAQMRTKVSSKPFLTITRIGEAPTGIDRKRKPGSGYWPGPDPPGGPDAHAVATMRKYKPWQGKEPPPAKSAVRHRSAPTPTRSAERRVSGRAP
jgi:hypothetical protein